MLRFPCLYIRRVGDNIPYLTKPLLVVFSFPLLKIFLWYSIVSVEEIGDIVCAALHLALSDGGVARQIVEH